MLMKLTLITITLACFTFACAQDPTTVTKEDIESMPTRNAVAIVNVESIVVPEPDSIVLSLPWIEEYSAENSVMNRFPVPTGYDRMKDTKDEYAYWLRRLPLKEGKPNVMLYDGTEKWNQEAHEAVLDIDVGSRDLQQCADACMRLRAEFLYHNEQADNIHFNYTNGANVEFSKWSDGYSPVPKSGKVNWYASSKNSGSYKSFKKYMIQIFNYAGTLSLSRELAPKKIEDMEPGDLFIWGGSPGHAVTIMDVAVHPETGNKVFMLSQSYMPAQEIHILKNPSNSELSPWYSIDEIVHDVSTPEWTFERDAVMRFE